MKRSVQRVKLAYSLHRQAKSEKKNVWEDASRWLLASRKNRRVVNLAEISRNSKDNSKILVVGKVLGSGSLEHKVTVAAYSFSHSAREKITSSGGKCVELDEFAKMKDSAKGVILIG